jgi:hypothetical protein
MIVFLLATIRPDDCRLLAEQIPKHRAKSELALSNVASVPSCSPQAEIPDKTRIPIAIAVPRWDCRRCAGSYRRARRRNRPARSLEGPHDRGGVRTGMAHDSADLINREAARGWGCGLPFAH